MIELIWEEIGKDEDGFRMSRPQRRMVPIVQEKSVTRSECYESMRAGVSVKTVFEIRQEDWEDTRHMVNRKPEYARKVVFDGAEYDIVRTYKVRKSTIEIVCA